MGDLEGDPEQNRLCHLNNRHIDPHFTSQVSRINVRLHKKVAKQSIRTCTRVGSDAARGLAMFVFTAGWKRTRHGHGKEGQVLSANLGLTVLAEAPVQSSSCVGGSSRFSLSGLTESSP